MDDLTPAQARALEILRAHGAMSAGALALLLWPDSPAWQRRTRRGAGAGNGAIGGTMPMKAGQILGRLYSRGLVARVDDYLWRAIG